MAKYKVKKQGCRLRIRVRLGSGEALNERELDFYTRKGIRGLLKATYRKSLLFRGLEYTGPVGIPLSRRLKQPLTRYDFFFLMEQVADLIQNLKKQSLSVKKVVWDVRRIYVNETTREMQFLYLPLDTAPAEVDLTAFLETILYSLQTPAEEPTDYLSEFTYFIKGLQTFDAGKLEQYIQKQEPEVIRTIKGSRERQSGFLTDKPGEYYAHYDPEEEATGLLAEEEEEATGLLTPAEEEEATGLLSGEAEEGTVRFPTLYRVSTGEQIQVNKPVFRLGKEKSYADYFIGDNPAVSRSHADVISRDGRFYVTDLNSRNRTYLNGQAIPVQVETELRDGDTLRLGNEEFVFYI